MSTDLLAPFRTQPSQPAVNPSAAVTQPTPGIDRHRSVADGELANAWTLKEFFVSLNSVMRLPNRARRHEKPTAEAAAAPSGTPGIHPGLYRFFLFAGGAVVVAVLVVKPLVSLLTNSGHASLTPVAGVWEAGKGKHEGRKFEVTDSAVVFHTGERATDYTWHRVQAVKVKQVGDSSLYTVKYEEGKGTVDLTFWYIRGAKPGLRLKNQPAVRWALTKERPVTGPPPSNRPRL